jgi:hypothetical protein
MDLHDLFMKYYNKHEDNSMFVIVALHRIACIDIMHFIRDNITKWLPVDMNNCLKSNLYELQFPNFHIVARSRLHTFNDTNTDNKDNVFVTTCVD